MNAATTEPARELRRVRPRRGAPEDTRTRLLAAAADAFNRHGFHNVDSNRIAKEAGYATGTFYKHFPDKRAAFLAAYEAWVTTEWNAIGGALAARRPRAELAERILALVLEHHQRWRGLRASMSALLVEDVEVRAFHRAQRRRQLDLLAALRLRGDTPPVAGVAAPARTAEDDALLLFTLERTCDAIANGEARDLGLDRERLLAVLRRQIEAALMPGPTRAGAARVAADADVRPPRRERTAPPAMRRPR